jgi:hypothetical protein
MEIKVIRYSSSPDDTLGIVLIDGVFECYSLEDEKRAKKVFGETRIPNGSYNVGLRTEGGHHNKYLSKFPSFHKGMLHVLNVPNFEYILIHIGNDDDDTAGCLLVGDLANNNKIQEGFISSSTQAYVRLYKKVVAAINRGDRVVITYKTI